MAQCSSRTLILSCRCGNLPAWARKSKCYACRAFRRRWGSEVLLKLFHGACLIKHPRTGAAPVLKPSSCPTTMACSPAPGRAPAARCLVALVHRRRPRRAPPPVHHNMLMLFGREGLPGDRRATRIAHRHGSLAPVAGAGLCSPRFLRLAPGEHRARPLLALTRSDRAATAGRRGSRENVLVRAALCPATFPTYAKLYGVSSDPNRTSSWVIIRRLGQAF